MGTVIRQREFDVDEINAQGVAKFFVDVAHLPIAFIFNSFYGISQDNTLGLFAVATAARALGLDS